MKIHRTLRIYLIGLLAMVACPVLGQLRPSANFSQDSIQIGQPVQLSVSISYKSNRRLLFPDSSYNFSPFELVKKDYFPTVTVDSISKDSVIYVLTTFSLDSVQGIQIPIYEFSGKDSSLWLSENAEIKVIPAFSGPLPEKPVVFTETMPVHVPTQFNYPYLILAIVVFLALVLGVNFFFNRPIQRFLYLFIERRRNTAYLAQFQRMQTQLDRNLSVDTFEKVINLWKKYIQRMDGTPYTTFTSTEIIKVLPQPELKDSLQEIDRWIYGGVEMKDWRNNLKLIKEVSLQLYNKKRETIRSGKFD